MVRNINNLNELFDPPHPTNPSFIKLICNQHDPLLDLQRLVLLRLAFVI